jgi:hypothetical protein
MKTVTSSIGMVVRTLALKRFLQKAKGEAKAMVFMELMKVVYGGDEALASPAPPRKDLERSGIFSLLPEILSP